MEMQLWGESQTQTTGSGLTLGWLALLVSRAKGELNGWFPCFSVIDWRRNPCRSELFFFSECALPLLSQIQNCVCQTLNATLRTLVFKLSISTSVLPGEIALISLASIT